MVKPSILSLIAIFVLLPTICLGTTTWKDCKAKEQYYKDKEKGWYFREKCEEIEKREKKQEKKPEEKIDWAKVADPKYLDTLDAEKFRKLLDRAKDEAVYNPSKDRLFAYMKMQDYMRAKSLKFAHVWRDVLLENPHLDQTVKNPGSNYGAHAKAEIVDEERTKMMREIKETVGLFFFVSGECPYCHKQNNIIERLRKNYDMAVRVVSSDYCDASFKDCSVEPFMFEQFQVKATPTMVSVMRDSNDRPIFQPIGTGIVTLDEIVQRLVFYYNYHKTGRYPE